MKDKHFAVIGLGFGDEGKGTVVDYLAHKNPGAMVIRYSGGHQAGHTVERNGIRHIFSNFGSGTLNGNATYISPFCTIDPEGMLKEYQLLTALGIENIDIFVDADCPVTTPYEKWNDIKYQKMMQHGSCGVGVGTTFAREQAMYHLTFGDLFYPSIFEKKLDLIREHYYRYAEKPENLTSFFFAVEAIKKFVNITWGMPTGVDQFIFEGSQGLMLDQHTGFFPHVTRSNTGSKNILQMVGGFKPFLVTRPYETRHGNGPMTGLELPDDIFYDNIEETNVTNEYQGEFRKAMLNLDTLKYALSKDQYLWKENNVLVVTCIDHVKEYYFSLDGKVFTFDNPDVYASAIAARLGINEVMINNSSNGSTFMRI